MLQSRKHVSGVGHDDLLRLYKPETAKHYVQFYERDQVVIERVSYLAGKVLEAGDSSVLIATAPHRQAIENNLRSALDLESAREAGRFVALDAAQTLEQFLVDANLDWSRFQAVVGTTIRRAIEKSASRFVFAFGEMVAQLSADQKPHAAITLERFWNALAANYRFSLLCAYPLEIFCKEPDFNQLLKICSQHDLTIPAELPLQTPAGDTR
jgi:hypothetical protein